MNARQEGKWKEPEYEHAVHEDRTSSDTNGGIMKYGRYQIIKEVGRGSMGVVYQARDPNIDRLVAVKVLRQDRTENETFVRRFLKEAKVIGRLSHPHIVTIYDVGEEHGTVYIAMEYLEGVSLAEIIRERRPDTKSVLKFGVQMAETLEYAHGKGVIHRDIKPSNIIVQSDCGIKITDFGVARIEDSTATLQTLAGEIMGTPAYMSPEQVLGQSVDGRSDLFSLGVILYELCTGKRPFGGEGKNLATVFNEIININPPEPYAAKALIPRELSVLIMKMLEKDPAKRIQTGGQLASELKNCLKGETYAAGQKSGVSNSNSRYGLVLVIALTVLVIGGSFFYFSRNKEVVTVRQPVSPGHALSRLKRVFLPFLNSSGREKTQLKPAGTGNNRPMSITQPSTQIVKKPEITATKPSGGGNSPARPMAPTVPTVSFNKMEVPNARPPLQVTTPVKKTSEQISKPGANPPRENVKSPARPATAVRQDAKKDTAVKPVEQVRPPDGTKPMPKFAFLKVRSTPNGANVYINGVLKGTTPLIVKLDLGDYRVRVSRSGYSDKERQISLEKMTDYSVRENLKRIR